MSELDPYDRLEYKGDVDPVMERVCEAYGLDDYAGFEVIPVGYEDFNVLLRTANDDYFVKIFASSRSSEEVARYGTIMSAVMDGGIRHPKMLPIGEGLLHTDSQSGLTLSVMEFVKGETFYDVNQTPNNDELDEILGQVARIHSLPIDPPFLNDSWAIPNIADQYKVVRPHLSNEERLELEAIIAAYDEIEHSELPYCFVHGDITKSNVIRSVDGGMFIVDFSVANTYPRIQELAVIIGNLVNDPDAGETLLQTMQRVVKKYVEQGGELTTEEMKALPQYVRAAYAMEFIGASREKFIDGNDSEENEYWRNLGWSGVTRQLS